MGGFGIKSWQGSDYVRCGGAEGAAAPHPKDKLMRTLVNKKEGEMSLSPIPPSPQLEGELSASSSAGAAHQPPLYIRLH